MKRNNRGMWFIVPLFIFLTGLLTFESAFAARPFHLGVALGLTGTGAPYSREAVEGIEIAVNEINARGGLLGKHSIRLFIRDTRTQPARARSVVTALIDTDRVKCVIGTYSSATALAIKPVCREKKVLHIATISNSENITKLDPSPYTYSVVPNTYMMAKAVAAGVSKLALKSGWSRYATIASDYAWGRSSQEIQVDLLRKVSPNLKLVATYWPQLGQTRFNSFIVNILAEKPDFLLGSIAGADNAFWMRDCRDYRFFKKVVYPGSLLSVTELIKGARSIRRGLYGRCRAPFFAHPAEPMMNGLVEGFRQKFDRYPSDWAVMAYDGVQVLRQGVEKAGSIEVEPIRKAMQGLAVETCRGKLYFRKIDNQLSCSSYFGRVADDPGYPFPVYHDLLELKAPDNWRPAAEISAARKK